MSQCGNIENLLKRLFSKEVVRGLFAASLFVCLIYSCIGFVYSADLYPGNGAAMSAESPDLPLSGAGMLVCSPSLPGDTAVVSTSAVVFSWTGPSTAAAAGLGAGSYFTLEVSAGDANFGAGNIAISVSTPILINPALSTADGAYISTVTLVHDISYYWRVRTVDGVSFSSGPWSQSYSFVTDFMAPAAVSDLVSAAASANSIMLSWKAPGDDGTGGALNNSIFTIQYTSVAADAQNALFWSASAAQINISTTGVNPGIEQYYTPAGLTPNTSYYFRLWTKDDVGNYSALSNGTTAATLSSGAAGGQVAYVYPSSMTVNWTPRPLSPSSATCEGYLVQASTASDFSGVVYASSTLSTLDSTLTVSGLDWANTTYYFRVGSLNWAGKPDYTTVFTTTTLAIQVAGAQVANVFISSVSVVWTPSPVSPSSSTCEGYLVQASTAPDFTGVIYSSATLSPIAAELTVLNLPADTTYYFRVGSLNWAGAANYAVIAGSTKTLTETDPPVIINNETADHVWYSTNTRAYNIDFTDTGGSRLYRFQVKAATGPNETGIISADWTDVVSNISSNAYTADWPLPSGFWTLLPEGVTNYISVRVYDGASNSSTTLDAFMVFKDTTPPARQGTVNDALWLSSSAVYDVNFYDWAAKLKTVQYSAWSAPAKGGTQLIPWTDLAADVASTSYETDWAVAQSSWALLQSGANYIALRAWDYAVPANTATWVDAFRVLKDTSPPDAAAALAGAAVSTAACDAVFSSPADPLSGIELFALEYATYSVVWSTSSADDSALNSAHLYVSTSGLAAGARAVIPFDGLAPNTSYYLRVWSRDKAQNWSDVSNASSVSTLADKVAGARITDVYFTSAAVSWNALPASPPGATCEGYLVQASTAADFTGPVASSATIDSRLSSIIVSGLSSGVTNYFRAASLNWSGAPDYASAISVVTQDNVPPAAVASLAGVAVASAAVKLSWLAPGDNGDSGMLPAGAAFRIQYTSDAVSAADPLFWSTASARAVVPAGGVEPASEQSYEVAGLWSGTTCYFRLWTNDEAGNYSPFSNLAAVIMPPKPPSNVYISAVYPASMTVTWNTNGNMPGSRYLAEAANDEAFTMNRVSTVTAYTSYTFTGLLPNIVYFAHVRTLGEQTLDSSFVDSTAAPTVSAPVTDTRVSEVFAASATLSWTDEVNPEGTSYKIMVSSDNFAGVYYSTVTSRKSFTVYALAPNSVYYFKTAALNSAGQESVYADFPPTLTRANAPKLDPVSTFAGATEFSVQVRWLPNSNPAGTEYFLHVSTSPDFLGQEYGTGIWAAWSALVSVTPLNPATTYYFEAKARDALLRETAWLELGLKRTLTGADTIPPAVIDLQTGDDVWRGAASGYYKVHFSDLESGLSKFEVKLTTSPGMAGTPLAGWTEVVTDINAQKYDADWQLPLPVFQTITEGVTAYASVRVYDRAAAPNVTVAADVFYVIRDTTPPSIVNGAVSPLGWRDSDPGPFNVDFFDARSGLAGIQYSASGAAGAADAAVLDWTDIDTLVSSKAYTADWSVAFQKLAAGATNYISVRAIDAAGNMTTLADAFKILKRVGGPGVSFISPAAVYLSTVTALTGSAAGGNDDISVNFVEVSLKDLAGGKYYNGLTGAFSSDAPAWVRAEGTRAWSLNVDTFGVVDRSSYTAVARAKDSLDRYSLIYATLTFTMDQDPPAVALSSPTALSTVYCPDAITGSAGGDASGLAGVGIGVKRIADGKWWNFFNSEWGTVQSSSLTAVSGVNWSFQPDLYLRGNMLSGHDYFVTAYAFDSAVPANYSAFGLIGSTFTFVDAVPPGQTVRVWASTDPASVAPGRLRAAWVFPGDDGQEGLLAAGGFAIKYATFTGFGYSTGSAQVQISTASILPGSTQTYMISGLANSTSYYLRLWTKDDAGLWSPASPEFSGLSGEALPSQIAGHVRTATGQGITGVLVEALNVSAQSAALAYTIDDGIGSFVLSGLDAGVYRIQVTWIENGISSSVSKDGIPVGYADSDFTLSVAYQLASISGQLVNHKLQTAAVRPSAATARPYPAEEVELYQRGRLVATARADGNGEFKIANLLPGDYELKLPDSAPLAVHLNSGQNLVVSPLSELLIRDSVYVYPDPASRWLKFHFITDDPSVTKEISVFDVAGRLVKMIRSDAPGWSGTGNPYEFKWVFSGAEPASGVYFYKLNIKSQTTGKTRVKTGKLAVIR